MAAQPNAQRSMMILMRTFVGYPGMDGAQSDCKSCCSMAPATVQNTTASSSRVRSQSVAWSLSKMSRSFPHDIVHALAIPDQRKAKCKRLEDVGQVHMSWADCVRGGLKVRLLGKRPRNVPSDLAVLTRVRQRQEDIRIAVQQLVCVHTFVLRQKCTLTQCVVQPPRGPKRPVNTT